MIRLPLCRIIRNNLEMKRLEGVVMVDLQLFDTDLETPSLQLIQTVEICRFEKVAVS